MAGTLSSCTPSQPDSFDSPVVTPLSLKITLAIAILGVIGIVLLFVGIWWSIKRHYRHKRQQPHTDGIPLNPMGNRREASDISGSGEQPTEFGVAAIEDEDPQFGNEAGGSPVVPVGPLDTGASETAVSPINPEPSEVAAPDVAPDNNALREPQAVVRPWHDPKLGNLEAVVSFTELGMDWLCMGVVPLEAEPVFISSWRPHIAMDRGIVWPFCMCSWVYCLSN